MPRNARQRGGSRHNKGRKAGPRLGTANASQKSVRHASMLGNFVQEDGESAPLHLGGFRVHCNNGSVEQIQSVRSRGRGRSQRGHSRHSSHRQTEHLSDTDSLSSDDSSLDSDDVADYLANVEPHSADSASAEEQGRFLLNNFDNNAAQSAEEGASDSSDSHSCTHTESEDEESAASDDDSDGSIDDIITTMEDGLSLMERYPVLLNEKPPQSNLQGLSSSAKRKQRSAVRGAHNGKLLPGEKKRLKREKMQAKRASRAAGQGLDLEAVNVELIQFVLSGGDMKGFPPMNKYGLHLVMKLASCYGLKASAQGSGKKQFVVVASCERTRLPTSQDTATVKHLLSQQQQFEAAMQVVKLGSRSGAKTKRTSGQATQAQMPRFNVPVNFISSGCINSDTLEMRPAMQAAQAPLHENTAEEPLEAEAGPAQNSRIIELPAADFASVVPEAPWNNLDTSAGYDTGEPSRLGLGCSALPDYEYEGAAEPSCDGQSFPQPLYDRFDAMPLGAAVAEPGEVQEAAEAAECSSGAEEEEPVPFGSYVYERRADLPDVFKTKQDVKRSKKKQEKLARRAQRNQFAAAALVPPAQPTASATGLHYGKFEQHTTGYGSRMLAKWGFSGQGSGLGREQQGIAEPVAAVVRPKKLGLGH